MRILPYQIPYLPKVLDKKGLSKQCRPRSDAANAASDHGLHCLSFIQHVLNNQQVVNLTY